jgi:hypothetical protein
MLINGQEVNGKSFAYDRCHKIYIIEDDNDLEEAKDIGYDIYPLEDLASAYENSCELKFISNWKLNKQYVEQFADCIFE